MMCIRRDAFEAMPVKNGPFGHARHRQLLRLDQVGAYFG
jgi:hypothetical protein